MILMIKKHIINFTQVNYIHYCSVTKTLIIYFINKKDLFIKDVDYDTYKIIKENLRLQFKTINN